MERLEELKNQLSRLHSDLFMERALLVEQIVLILRGNMTVRSIAKVLSLSHTYIYEELKIAKFSRLYPELADMKERKLVIRFIRSRKRRLV